MSGAREIRSGCEPARRTGSFWLEGLPRAEAQPALRGSARCDIAIVGGGLTGLSTAHHARRLLPGARVRLLEATECARGASGRSAGFSTSLFGLAKGLTAMRFGRERAIEAHRYMQDAVSFSRSLIAEHRIECDYERSGTLHVATTPAQARRIEAELRTIEEWGLEGTQEWGSQRLATEFPGGGFIRGIFDGRNAVLNPARLTRGLVQLALQSGAVVHEHSPVVAVEEVDDGFCLRTTQGELHAERLVFATNAYSGMFRPLKAKQTPVLNHVLVTEPIPEDRRGAIGWQSRCGIENARNLMHYLRWTADGRILIGGGDIEPVYGRRGLRDEEYASGATAAHLERALLRLFPQLEGVRVTHQWSGPISLAADMAPVISRIGRHGNALFAGGLMGHGVSMAPYNGLCLAELLAGQSSPRTEVFFVGRRVLPWPPHPVRFPVLQAARLAMKVEDRLRWD